jgi:hypothetical protein
MMLILSPFLAYSVNPELMKENNNLYKEVLIFSRIIGSAFLF